MTVRKNYYNKNNYKKWQHIETTRKIHKVTPFGSYENILKNVKKTHMENIKKHQQKIYRKNYHASGKTTIRKTNIQKISAYPQAMCTY